MKWKEITPEQELDGQTNVPRMIHEHCAAIANVRREARGHGLLCDFAKNCHE